MQICPVTSYNNKISLSQSQAMSFKGELSNRQYMTILERLKKVNSAVEDRFSVELLDNIMNTLVKRYECLGVRSVALQIISNKDLPILLGEDASKYDLKDKIGICIAVGDRKGPIESMTNIYDAYTLLAKESDLSR